MTPDDSGHVRSLEERGRNGHPRLGDPRRPGTRPRRRPAPRGRSGDPGRRIGEPHPATSPAWTMRARGRTSRAPRHASCPGRSPSSAAGRPASSWPRSTPATASRSPSSIPRDRVHDREHRRSSELLGRVARGRWRDAPARAPRRPRVRAGEGTDGAHVIELDGRDEVAGPRDHARHRPRPPARRPRARHDRGDAQRMGASSGTSGCGSPRACTSPATSAGPELHTHLGHYTGEAAARIALGDDYSPVLRRHPARHLHRSGDRIGRAAAGPGEGARHRRRRVHRRHRHLVQGLHDRDRWARHDRGRPRTPTPGRRLHGRTRTSRRSSTSAVLAIRADVPLDVLADTIHAFPTMARVLGTAFIEADRDLR